MRQVLETDIEAYLRHFPFAGLDEGMGSLQPASDNPFLRRQVANFLEITLKRSKTAPCIFCNLLHCQVIHVIFVQEIKDVNLPWSCEIEQRGIKILVCI